MIKNIAAYHFVVVEDPDALAGVLRARAEAADLRGTILVAGEGVNLFLAGGPDAIDGFVAALRADARFADLIVKASESDALPFARLKVKVKPEIISFRMPDAEPIAGRAPAVLPEALARWIAQGCDDDGRRLVLLDTRNREEVAYGSFVDALTLPIDNFTELPDAVLAQRDAWTDATVVSFCTGGIRCEKAALWMRAQGMDNVLQLDGGILGYFEAVGGFGYDGACFVFDDRVALGPGLDPVRPPMPATMPAPFPRVERAESATGGGARSAGARIDG
ncbi:sulfurtransferase [Lysobacter hankyongensis]|uniref:Sulfurtransferase n=1 Tax=Lysobacter hankyongensis TaxID=1176535 RepID=A0ABP9CAE7_9GAMM